MGTVWRAAGSGTGQYSGRRGCVVVFLGGSDGGGARRSGLPLCEPGRGPRHRGECWRDGGGTSAGRPGKGTFFPFTRVLRRCPGGDASGTCESEWGDL